MGLARNRPVVYLSPVQVHELATRLTKPWKPVRRLRNGRLTVLSPVIFSGEYRNATVRRMNRRVLLRLIRQTMGGERFQFLTNSPFSGWLLDHLDPVAVIYDMIDDFCAFDWAPEDGWEQQGRILERADLAVAGTGTLADRLIGWGLNAEFLSSGVKHSTLSRPAAEPEDLQALPGPRLLYVGTLNDRLDGRLFASLARRFPTGSIVVVGPRHGTFRAPAMPPNVHFLGPRPHEALSGYYQHCDLGLMPFADVPAARAINPIKTLEYLACGLPVISTPIPDVVRYYPEVVSAVVPAEWPEEAARLLASDNPEARDLRRDFARGRSWGRLVAAFEERLARLESGVAP